MATPDEAAFRADLDGDAFRAGVLQGRWSLLALAWPNAVIAVHAPARPGAPDAYALRFELTNYPSDAPTATPWDVLRGAQLGPEGRPKGHLIGFIFRTDWENGKALYAPCDRVAIAGHGDWPQQYAGWTWDASKDITHCLRLIWDRLNDPDYTGL